MTEYGLGWVVALIGLIFFVIYVIAWWRIFAKTGWPGVMGLLMLVPVVNVIMLLVLAFGTWPIHKQTPLEP